MGTPAWLTGALAAASAATGALGLQGTVSHEPWTGQDSYGAPLYGTAISRKAMIQEGSIPHRRGDAGEVITTRACIAFQEDIQPNGASGRREPVDPRDRVTIRPGQETAITGPIADVRDVLVNPATGAVIRSTVWLR